MVWSMGFSDGLPVTVGHEMLDGDIRKIEYVDTTYEPKTMGGHFKPGELHAGRPIKADHLPTRVVRGGRKGFIPDVVWGVNLYFVNDRFKDVVERLEPGVHQFFPMQMLWQDGTLAQEMYVFNVCNRLDTVDRERTTAELRNGRLWLPETGEIVFSEAQIGDHHVWVDKHTHMPQGLFVSDPLHDALLDAEVTGLSFTRQKSTGDL